MTTTPHYTFEPLEPRRLLAANPLGVRVVGYFPEYRYSLFSRVDLAALTHLNYFSVLVNANGSLNTGSIDLSHMATIVSAAHAAGTTVSITVGPQSFLGTVNSPTALSTFVSSIVSFANQHDFDGIDIDWEPPDGTNVPQFTTLINALDAAAGDLLLTAAVNPVTKQIAPAATAKLDWINVMGYDFWPNSHSTYADSTAAMNSWAAHIAQAGQPKSKLVLGVPFYGRRGTTWGNTQTDTYSAIVNQHITANGGVGPHPDADLIGTWYANGRTTIANKTNFVVNNGFGGMMIWELGQDHFAANGQFTQYSLFPVIKGIVNPPPPTWLAPAAGASYTLVGQALTINGGGVSLIGDASATHPNLNVIVNTGASMSVAADQRLASLTLNGTGNAVVAAGGAFELVTRLLTIGAAAQLDLKDNSLIVDYSSVSPVGVWTGSAYNGITGMIKAGRIISSNAVAALTTLGVAEARQAREITGAQTSLWSGQTVDATSVLVRCTYGGDANLDGKVNVDDYGQIDANVSKSGSVYGWFAGDFNLDGTIDIDDYGIIDGSIERQTPLL